VLINAVIKGLPEDARVIIQELANDPTVESIWLIGSRANSRARRESDWDFLVFFNTEPIYVTQRRQNIDLLRVGPSGAVRPDGGEEIDFRDFRWKPIDDRRAAYRGKQFIPYEPLVARDGHEPVFKFFNDVAHLVYEK
jgi:predicted nucleotidyltransferase